MPPFSVHNVHKALTRLASANSASVHGRSETAKKLTKRYAAPGTTAWTGHPDESMTLRQAPRRDNDAGDCWRRPERGALCW
jgi:hypothetical protein